MASSKEGCVNLSDINNKDKKDLPCDASNDVRTKAVALLSHFDVVRDGRLLCNELANI